MGEAPEPPVPLDLDLREFRWMKLDLLALFNSDFNGTTDDTAWRAGVTLWGKSWHQIPAGSLPDDDAALCHLAGLGRDLRTWRRIRPTALHGFRKCADGRLYHDFLCRLALEAKQEHDKFLKRRAADRDRKSGRLSGGIPSEPSPDPPEHLSVSGGIPSENTAPEAEFHVETAVAGAGQGEGQGKGFSNEKPKTAREARLAVEEFENWWLGYPHKVGKGAAREKFRKARQKVSCDILVAGVVRYVRTKPPDRPWCNPAVWLNQERWLDEPAEVGANGRDTGRSDPDVSEYRGPSGPAPPLEGSGFGELH